MNAFAKSIVFVVLAAAIAPATDDKLMESVQSASDVALDTNSDSPFWQGARPAYAEKDKRGKPIPRYRTEIRSRWTKSNLYFLFICPYEKLYLKPAPSTSTETFQLWDWDVAEVFIGADFHNIQRYKEFELSPQGEWIDLDIDLSNPHKENGWTWNSGFQVAARIDGAAKVWYGAMRIPFSAIDRRTPVPGNTFRINLFRIQGAPPERQAITWQPSMSDTFHVPSRFGLLKLVPR